MGYEAVLSLIEDRGNRIICTHDGRIVDLDMEEALAMTKQFQMDRYQVLEAWPIPAGCSKVLVVKQRRTAKAVRLSDFLFTYHSGPPLSHPLYSGRLHRRTDRSDLPVPVPGSGTPAPPVPY